MSSTPSPSRSRARALAHVEHTCTRARTLHRRKVVVQRLQRVTPMTGSCSLMFGPCPTSYLARCIPSVQRAPELGRVVRDRGCAPQPHVLALFVEDRVLVIEAVERLREPEALLRHTDSSSVRTACSTTSSRRAASNTRPHRSCASSLSAVRTASEADATADATAAWSRPCRSFSLLKMLFARTTAYWRYGRSLPLEARASSMSNR